MNMQNVKTTYNLSLRKKLRVLKLEAHVNGMNKVKNQLDFLLILKNNDPLKRL